MGNGSMDIDELLEAVAGGVAAQPLPSSTGVTTGQRVGAYCVEGMLGAGGMGTVYAATRVADGAPFALKLLRPFGSGEHGPRRFAREAASLVALDHPAIVRAHDTGVWDERPYLVLDRVEGISLRERLDDQGTLSIAEVDAIFTVVLDALVHAHGKGIVHRDLKPANVLLTGPSTEPAPVVLDFGLAKITGSTTLTRSGLGMGTPLYASPEQLRDAARAGPASDLYAVGVMMYEALSGELPHRSRDLVELLLAKARGGAPPIEGLDAERNALIASALSPDPEQRPTSAAEMGARLRAIG